MENQFLTLSHQYHVYLYIGESLAFLKWRRAEQLLAGFPAPPCGRTLPASPGAKEGELSECLCQFYHTGDSCSMLLLGWEGRLEY